MISSINSNFFLRFVPNHDGACGVDWKVSQVTVVPLSIIGEDTISKREAAGRDREMSSVIAGSYNCPTLIDDSQAHRLDPNDGSLDQRLDTIGNN